MHEAPRASRHLTYRWGEASARWGKTPFQEEHQACARRSPEGWREATEDLDEVVRLLGAVPAEDVATWRAVASDAAGVLAVLSGRLERSPGPLARLRLLRPLGPRPKAGAMAWSPRGTITAGGRPYGPKGIRRGHAGRLEASLGRDARVAQAVHDAHLARSESQQAGRLADEARMALGQARARLGEQAESRGDPLGLTSGLGE